MNTFLTTYHMRVFNGLQRIHAHAMTEHGRFLALTARRGYVQCLFIENDARILCEASSNFYGFDRRISPSARTAIAREGFDMDGRHGNFQRLLPIDNPATSLWNVADLMLETLYRGYGARMTSKISVSAPLLAGEGFQ